MSDIVETARTRASSYRIGGPSSEHTAALLDELADTITTLRAENERLTRQNDFLANDRDGYVQLLSVAELEKRLPRPQQENENE